MPLKPDPPNPPPPRDYHDESSAGLLFALALIFCVVLWVVAISFAWSFAVKHIPVSIDCTCEAVP